MLRPTLVLSCVALAASPCAQMPVLSGSSWHVTGNPDLGELGTDRQEPVDHAIFQSDDGRWHLWSCIRHTKVGRVLNAWESTDLRRSPWEPMGIAMRAESELGESIEDWGGQEWIQAPFVIRHAGRHHMFYGGHRSELGACQICVATSPDGRVFEKRRDEHWHSRVFVALCLADDDTELRCATGSGHNGLLFVVWDVAGHAGRRAYFRVVDASSDRWGHVNVDDFRIGR